MIAEVPDCLWIPAHRSNYGLRPLCVVGYEIVVIHINSGHGKAEDTAAMWQKPHHGSSAHLCVGQDGTLVQAVPLRFAAFHAHSPTNGRSVGIEHCCREPNEPSFPPGDPGLPPSDALYAKSAWLVAYLLKAAGKPVVFRETIDGHNHVDPKTTHTGCPDAAPWDWDRYLAMVQTAYDQIASPPALV